MSKRGARGCDVLHEVAMCSRNGTGHWEAGEGTSRDQIVAVMGPVTAVIEL